jgi:hypothetical protein
MVGEQVQEMQLAHWISRTDISWLANVVPAWMGMWFAVFPTYETMGAQLLAAILVVGSYYAASHMRRGVRSDSSELANATAASSMSARSARRSGGSGCLREGSERIYRDNNKPHSIATTVRGQRVRGFARSECS